MPAAGTRSAWGPVRVGRSQTTEDGRSGTKPSPAYLLGGDHPLRPLPASSPPPCHSQPTTYDVTVVRSGHPHVSRQPPHTGALQLVTVPHRDAPPSHAWAPAPAANPAFLAAGLRGPSPHTWASSLQEPPVEGELLGWPAPEAGIRVPAAGSPGWRPLHKLGKENYSPGCKGGAEGLTRGSGHLDLTGLHPNEGVQDSLLSGSRLQLTPHPLRPNCGKEGWLENSRWSRE